MLSLKACIPLLRRFGLYRFAKRVWTEMGNDNVFTLASAMAYSWIFSIFPFLIFLLSLVPLVISDDARIEARQTLYSYINETMPGPAAEQLRAVVGDVLDNNTAKKVSFLSIGLFITIWTASGGMAMTMSALDAAYEVKKYRSFVRQRVVAIVLTVVAATMVIAVLFLLPIGTLAVKWMEDYGTSKLTRERWNASWIMFLAVGWDFIRFALAFLLVFSLTAIIYRYGPNHRRKLRFFTPGSIFCVSAWAALAIGFRIYVERFGNYEAYKAVGGVIVMLLVFYLNSLVLLIGAEINAEIEKINHERG
jgi:membrane protein